MVPEGEATTSGDPASRVTRRHQPTQSPRGPNGTPALRDHLDNGFVLEQRIADLAGFYRDHGHARLAYWLEHQLDEDPADLAPRVRVMFRHGEGGLTDPALGEDEAERDRLAEALWQAAVDGDG